MNRSQQRYLRRLECSFDRLEFELLCRGRPPGQLGGLLDHAASRGWPAKAYLALDLLSVREVRELLAQLVSVAARRGRHDDPRLQGADGADGGS